ncbi:MAG: phosphoglycerate dehydrogenase [Dehalococcoidia bacterium]|nr:phosphoglycerate dehydrogenase [Dehalococcoidia bacterium]
MMKALVSDHMAEEGVNTLRKYCEVDVKVGLPPEKLISIIGNYEALMVRSQTKVTASVIEAGKKLIVVARAGVGVDNIDIEAATKHGVIVVNAPTANTISAAEHTIALMLALARHIPQANASLKAREWKRSKFMGVEVRNKTLGIIGLGNIGSEVAKRAQGLEMNTIAHDPFIATSYAQNRGIELVSLQELIQKSDFLTIHTMLTSSTRNLIGKEELSLAKPTLRIINCARGGLINEEALLEAVERGQIAGAAIDVFTTEPATDNVLLKSDKIIVTPHLGASTEEAQINVAISVAEQVAAILGGQQARYALNTPFISQESLVSLSPFMEVASLQGKLLAQMIDGQMSIIEICYDGEITSYTTDALKETVISNLLEDTSEERINLINASVIARDRGIKITEHKNTNCENYTSLITTKVTTDTGSVTVGGTVMRGESHIVRVNEYWLDIKPSGGYMLLCDHQDRPGLIGQVGTITGNANVNVNSMHLSRLKQGGEALMVLEMDHPLNKEQLQQILGLAGIHAATVVNI